MKKLLILIGAIAAYGQTVSISDTLTNAVGGGSYAGRIVVTLNSPGSASPLYYSSTSLTGWQYVLCVGVTGTDCSSTTAAGVVTLTLYANSTITPAGTSYSARFTPSKGSPWTETWVVTPSTTTLRQVRSSTVPTPTTTFQASQLALAAGSMVYGSSAGVGTALAAGSNGQVLALSGGYPAWTTNIAGNAGTATALAANGTNCAAGTFPLGVDASGNSESCTALPTTISGTANQITASAATGAITLSLPATITGLTSVTSTGFTGALTGNASTATALSSTVASGRLYVGQGTGVPTSDSVICADTTNHRLGVGICSPTQVLHAKTSSGDARLILDAGTGSFSGLNFYVAGSDKGGVYYSGSAAAIVTYTSSGLVGYTFDSTRNVAIGNVSDLGYGLHAGKSGTNGTMLCYDPTAVSGTTKCVFQAGAGQSGDIVVVRNSAGNQNASINQNGYIVGSGVASSSTGLLAGAKLALGYQSFADFTLANDAYIGFTSSGFVSGSKDLSLSRSAANVLQVGDGGANANGYLSAARIGVGTASPGAFLDVAASSATAGVRVSNGSLNQNPQMRVEGYATVKLQSLNTPTDSRGAVGTESNSTLEFIVNNSGVARFATTGNLLIGGTTDGNYKLDVQNSGSSGTVRIFDQTATTGSTLAVIQAGAGQSGNLLSVKNYAGTEVLGVNSAGSISIAGTLSATGGSTAFGTAGAYTGMYGAGGLSLLYYDGSAVVRALTWNSAGVVLFGNTLDSGIARAGVNTLEVNTGTAGTLADLRVRSLRLEADYQLLWNGRAQLKSGADGVIVALNNAGSDFSRLQFGGTTSSFPALKRSSAILQARLADDSAYTDIGLNAVIVNKAAPAASSDACTAGQMWAGDMGGTKYTFYCVASGTIVRSAFVSF